MEKYFEYKLWNEIIWGSIAVISVLVIIVVYLVCCLKEKIRNKRRKK